METNVDLLVATHWHDDHVRGLARLVEICTAARFSCSSALTEGEFIAFAEQLSAGAGATDGAKVREITRVLRLLASRGATIRAASGAKTLRSWDGCVEGLNTRCEVRSLSPSDKEHQLFLEAVAAMIPETNAPKRSASRQTPNLSSVVLHVGFGDCAILLGADMEIHHDVARGWTSVLTEAETAGVTRSSVYKVAHHGSQNGHHEQVWTTLLHPRPVCVVTPFNRLPDLQKLPTEPDVARIKDLGRLFLTAPSSAKRNRQRDPAVLRSLRESQIEVRDLSMPVGLVRLRCRVGQEADWRCEAFLPAQELV